MNIQKRVADITLMLSEKAKNCQVKEIQDAYIEAFKLVSQLELDLIGEQLEILRELNVK